MALPPPPLGYAHMQMPPMVPPPLGMFAPAPVPPIAPEYAMVASNMAAQLVASASNKSSLPLPNVTNVKRRYDRPVSVFFKHKY